MSQVEIKFQQGPVRATIKLPASKSISNRALIIKALGELNSDIQNLSDSSDTRKLVEILHQPELNIINAGEGGTTSRFLLAFLSSKPGLFHLSVSGSMQNRPVGPLVESLRAMGAEIGYEERDGYFPLRIHGGNLTGAVINIPGDISSQFISAIMMIGPKVKGGMTMHITGEMISQPYIDMTKAVMEYYGTKVEWKNDEIRIPEGKYVAKDLTVESDWSAASYWYEIAALSSEASIFLEGLSIDSLQGDKVIASMMTQFGVFTEFEKSGAKITKVPGSSVTDYFEADFSGCPDLAPAVAVTCAALDVKADLHGLKNFRLKESDRASALQRELYQFGVKTDFCGGSKFKVYNGSRLVASRKPVNTYGDHRIAMAMAPLAMRTGFIKIDEPGVVSKSYPGFFDDLVVSGFELM